MFHVFKEYFTKPCLAGLICGLLVVILRVRQLYGRNSCQALLESGRYRGDMVWQPENCLMHLYTTQDTQTCFKMLSTVQHDVNNGYRVTFIGDSRIRQQYRKLRYWLTGRDEPMPFSDRHRDTQFRHDVTGTVLDFLWKPLPTEILALFHSWETVTSLPHFVVIGFGLHHLKKHSRQVDKSGIISTYQYYVSKMAEFFNSTTNTTYIWMVQDPIHEEHFKERVHKQKSRVFVSNELINIINEKATATLRHSHVYIWRSNTIVSKLYLNQTVNLDGVHVSDDALHWDSQILLNFLCNQASSHADGTCCNSGYR